MIPGSDHYLEDITGCQSGLDRLHIRQPATEALEEAVAGDVGENDFQLYHNAMTSPSSRIAADTTRRPIKNPFDMGDLEEATKPIIRSLDDSFPMIEWSFDGSIIDKSGDASSSEGDSEEPTSESSSTKKTKTLDYDGFVINKLKRSSSSLTGLLEKQPQHRRLVRSKGLSRLSMLESPFLPVSRNFNDGGGGEPTNVADFPLSYDIEKWIELAENVSQSLSTNDTTTSMSTSCLNWNTHSACSA